MIPVSFWNAICNGSFLITGFQNKDLKACLIKENYFSAKELMFPKKVTAKVSRIIAKLRAHKLIYKVANSCRFT